MCIHTKEVYASNSKYLVVIIAESRGGWVKGLIVTRVN